jgi:septum formation protein
MPILSTPLILASGSAVRRQMLEAVGLSVQVIPPDGCDEEALKQRFSHLAPAEKAIELAKGKAAYVSALHPESLVLAADQICAFGESILSKPATPERAAAQLRQLRGNTHHQHSGAALYLRGECIWAHVASATLIMRTLSDTEITTYIALDHPLSSCGAYMFEKHGKHLFAHVEGTDDIIQGLPLVALLSKLYDLGFLSL